LTLDDALDRDVHVQIDYELIREIAEGSAEALGRLYDRHAGKVYGLARRILLRAEDAEEVVQDVFAQIWRDAARYQRGRASVAGWMVVLARTRAIDRLRARRARPDQNRSIDPSPALGLVQLTIEADQEQITLSNEDARQVKEALNALPAHQRTLIDLAYYEGLSHSEIAARTNVPLGTVKTRIRTAMETLRGVLKS
jgi:RNA polymerase sigma-70 factor (ECF subfamily)